MNSSTDTTGWPNYYYRDFPNSTSNPNDPFRQNIEPLFNDENSSSDEYELTRVPAITKEDVYPNGIIEPHEQDPSDFENGKGNKK